MTSFVRVIGVALALGAMPVAAVAATLDFDAPTQSVSAGDTVVVRAYLDSAPDALNAFEGSVSLRASTASFTLKEVSRSGSALTIWLSDPVISADGKEFSFTGGTPAGIPGTHALLVSLVLEAKTPGTISISTSALRGYKDDGKGTAVSVTAAPLTFSISKAKAGTAPRNEWADIVASDTTPPEPFTVALGSDPSVFDGKKFISFQTTDGQSGIDRYEVKEGDAAPQASGITYVLKDQTASEPITVYAYDTAGNVRTASMGAEAGTNGLLWLIAGILCVLLLAGALVLFRRKNHA